MYFIYRISFLTIVVLRYSTPQNPCLNLDIHLHPWITFPISTLSIQPHTFWPCLYYSNYLWVIWIIIMHGNHSCSFKVILFELDYSDFNWVIWVEHLPYFIPNQPMCTLCYLMSVVALYTMACCFTPFEIHVI